jgi:branched-chain amino acid aminotransferase
VRRSYPLAHHDGAIRPTGKAVLPVDSLALRYGLSVFEGVRVYRGHGGEVRPFLLDRHLRRLRKSLELVRMPDHQVDLVPGVVAELLAVNEVEQDAYLRIAVSAGNAGLLGDPVVPVLTATVTPMGRKRWLAEGSGMNLVVSEWQRPPSAVFPPAAKNISAYAGPRLAHLAAVDRGYDGCVLVNAAGRLCEAPTATLFVVRGGVVSTPPLDEDVLPGITREWVLHTAASLGIPTAEQPLDRAGLDSVDEAFLCGTGVEFAPVRSIDDRPCRAWPAYPVTDELVDRYFTDVRGAAVEAIG